MLPHDRDMVNNCLKNAGLDRRGEDFASESSQHDYTDQEQYFHDDPQCPCYVCSNGIVDSKCNFATEESSTGVEFAVRSFWRLAKTQNDVESPMEGHCRGFHYKLLLHPRGTAGTDSEASHLSVFVEASVQDWYPQYWVFPNVRFELTVVNFKDPKQSVTSWAHWSFSSDATSRGWQKMISHSRLTKASGFMDEEGTVLVRGKADPPYPMLWSNSPLYHPRMMWEYIPNRVQREITAEVTSAERHASGKGKRLCSVQEPYPCRPSCTYDSHAPMCRNNNLDLIHGDPPYPITDKERERERERQLYGYGDMQGVYPYNQQERMNPEFGEPSMQMSLPPHSEGRESSPMSLRATNSLQTLQNNMNEDSDAYTDLNPEESLMHLQSENVPGMISNNTILKFLDSVIPAIQPTLDADLLALMTHILYHLREFRKRVLMWNPPVPTNTEGAKTGNGIILALQKTFAYMELYPLAAACKAYKLAGIDSYQLPRYYLYELLPKVPNLKKSYGAPELSEGNNPNNGSPEKNGPAYESNMENYKYTGRNQKNRWGPWNRMYMPIPFPSPTNVPGYNAEGEEFSQVNCCYFDGGRYEWELVNKGAEPTKEAAQSSQPSVADKVQNLFSTTDGSPGNYKLFPGTLSYTIGSRADIFDKLLPPPPNIKLLLKAMHMSDLQVLETQDQLISLHTALFTMLLRDLAAAKRNLKHQRLVMKKNTKSSETSQSTSMEYNLPLYLRDQTELEATCKALFSGSSENEGLFHDGEVNDIASIYIRCKHSHSLQKALENSTKTMTKFPHVLFFYLYPAKNAKKGELFDIPLRLDCTSLCDGTSSPDEAFDVHNDGHPHHVATSGDNTSGSGISEGPVNYCDYTDDDDEEEDDDDGDDDGGSDSFANFDHGRKKGKKSSQIKWYSLYALILREGDVRSESNVGGSGSCHSLLLRPEEDGPWYRIFEGKVEKLSTKMEFTEWKCHRDFFCAAAIYIAEDYIDMHQIGELDLSGNIKTWNPKLFHETLELLGITEGDISNPSFTPLSRGQSETITDGSNVSVDELAPLPCNVPGSCNTSPRGIDEGKQLKDGKSHLQAASGLEMTSTQQKDDQDVTQEDATSSVIVGATNSEYQTDFANSSLIYNRKVGQRHPRLSSCCEVHGYTPEFLSSLNEREISNRYAQPASQKEICRRMNRANTIRPFLKWLFHASKENTALLNGIKPPADGKMLVKFLQQRERYFEEEFRHIISEIVIKEIGEHMALNSIYKWSKDNSCCGCSCNNCVKNCPASLLTENGHFPGEELKTLLEEPSTILFRNIQILRCHLEYFCKDCRNLSLQLKEEHRAAELHEFKATSERSALFLIECIWDACVRYIHDCRTILYLKAISDNPAATTAELGLNRVSTLIKPSGMPTAKQTGAPHPSMDQCRDLFVFDGALSQSSGPLGYESMDYYDAKYDLSVANELKIMKYCKEKYQIPTVSKMRIFLRERHVLVYCYIRPHELVRAYVQAANPGSNIKNEIESLVPGIIWNEAAFEQRVTLDSLTKEERDIYDVYPSLVDVHNSIGHKLCDIYEELITKMLLHMQDAERNLGGKIYDYIYTSADVSRIAEAIEAECTKTISRNMFLVKSPAPDEACTCELVPSDCRPAGVLPNSGFFSDFGFSRGPFSLDYVEIEATMPLSLSRRASIVTSMTKSGDNKKKQKSKVRKQTAEETCVIPPLDRELRDVVITQKTAHRADPKLFPNLNDIIKYPNGPHCLQGTGVMSKLRRWGEYNSLLYNQELGYDFNVAGGFASMLRLKNHDQKAIPNPLLEHRKYNEVDALRIKYAYEIGILTTHDLCGCEGFALEEKLEPRRRLQIYHEYVDEKSGKKTPVRVEHLYWGLRKLLQQQLPAEMDSTFVQASKAKKTKGANKCVCGGNCNTNEFECSLNMRWKPLPRDAFMLYALRPDHNNPIRRGRRRFTFMHPEYDFSHYVDSSKRQVNPKSPDVIILIVGAPISVCSAPAMPFPMVDDSEYPLLLFKWMCLDSVDLICYGAVVCDAKKQLQNYIFEWLLPLVREMGVLPKLEPNEKEDIERYQILEECSVRTVQNVRRWSCAIRKINKRTGDIIIAQAKRLGDSPASLKFKESVEFMHTVRELAELEALEFLPPAENSEFVQDFHKGDADTQDTSEKVADDVQKLAKKKKKKTPKAAIPSNKKSTFSKSIVSVEVESERKASDSTEVREHEPEEEETNKAKASEKVKSSVIGITEGNIDEEDDEDDDDDEEDDDDDDEDDEDEDVELADGGAHVEDEKATDSISISALVEEILDSFTSSRSVIDRNIIEKQGIQDARLKDLLYKMDLPTMLSNEDSLVKELFSYVRKVVEEEEEAETPADIELSRNHVIVVLGQRTRTCVDIILSSLKSLQDYTLMSAFRELVDSVYVTRPTVAAGMVCYALCAMGNTSLSESLKSAVMKEFVSYAVSRMSQQIAEKFYSFFEEGVNKYTVSSLLLCLCIYSSVNTTISEQCDKDSSLMFLMNTVRDKLTPIEEDLYGEEEVSEMGFRVDTLQQSLDYCDQDDINLSDEIIDSFKSSASPFGEEERLVQFEQLALQELKIWWYRREASLFIIKSKLSAGKVSFVVSNDATILGEEGRRIVNASLPVSISQLELKCLKRFFGRFKDEVELELNGNVMKLALRDSPGSWEEGIHGDAEGVIKAVERLVQLTCGYNMNRAVANKELNAFEKLHVFSDLDDIRLWGKQGALVTMSMRHTGALNLVTTKEIEGIVQHYYARTMKSIPQPPNLPPQQPRI